MSLYSFMNQEPIAIDVVVRKQSGLEMLWQELKWDEFFQAVELQ